MKNYLINYDLNLPGQNYAALWEELRRLNGFRVLASTWVIPHLQSTAIELRDHLKRYVDANDGLFVTRVPKGEWASLNAKVDSASLQGVLNS
jgi:hypothetical protein